MNIECVVEKLESAVSKAYRVTGKNLTLPILSALYLKAHNNSLIIKATNLDIGVEVTIPVRVIKDGEIAIPADVFMSFINSISKNEKLNLNVIDGVVEIQTPTNKTKITTQSIEDFPSIPHIEKGKKCHIKKQNLISGLQSVVFSASHSSIKPELSSVYIYNKNNQLFFVATDSFRLAEKNVSLEGEYGGDSILLPAKNIPEIIRICDDGDDEIEIITDINQISFSYNGVYIVSRTIDGVFPDYNQIIPKEYSTEVTLLKDDFIKALKTVTIFSNKLNQVTFSIKKIEKYFSISTKNTDVGETETKLNASIEGDDVVITFNHKYIIDCFSSINTDSVILKLNNENKPMVIKPVSDSSFLYLVMPMNV